MHKISKTVNMAALMASLALISSQAMAVDVDAAKGLAKQNNCFRCHGIDKDKDGPAWNKIAAKFKGDAKAEEKLTKHVTSGVKVKFPDGHEEEHTVLKTDDKAQLKNLIDWILSL